MSTTIVTVDHQDAGEGGLAFRQRLLDLVQAALEPLDEVLAMIEGGSAAFDRADEFSDADVHVIVRDAPEAVAAAFDAVDRALAADLTIDDCWVLPEPTWHGHAQRIYRFADAAPWSWLDLLVMRAGSDELFTEPEQHGRQRICFDKAGVAVAPPFDAVAFRERMRRELAQTVEAFEATQPLVVKQWLRGSVLGGLGYYRGRTLAPLATVLGMRYAPLRYMHGVNYIAPYLPADVRQELEAVSLVADLEDLAAKHARAVSLFRATVAELDVDAIDLEGLSAQLRG